MDIRDHREPGHFWADNEIFDDYAPRIGVHAFAVYLALTRYSNRGVCCPSIGKIAKQLRISVRTVHKAMTTLKETGLIEITDQPLDPKKGQLPHIFTLLKVPKHAASPAPDAPPPMQEVQGAYAPDAPPPMQEVHRNNTKLNKTRLTNDDARAAALKRIGLRADQRQAILKEHPDLTLIDIDPWRLFVQSPPPWCRAPEAYAYKALLNGDSVPAARSNGNGHHPGFTPQPPDAPKTMAEALERAKQFADGGPA